ncbi:hypothetical protein PRIPAC_94748 [Pristionchus pacificus]|uniref:Uncharacterized protein n=1 Tax=Pristionchus pacificus TaxID=54126 RepID=A0A2A6BBT9_PRIPA|nr:hypothetical protein PRIPAC_94748 [Pristionchus pacificus]|eukprot:PDM63340.1 hypothetical protein PRIPAC_50555 [Pristionchus pacificus]
MGTATGLAACAVASVFFGSVFVPVKRHDAGNGLFVQWVMSAGILLIGLTVGLCFSPFPTFHPLAMLGGALWSIGNATAVPIMGELGIGLGMLVWGLTNVLTGWACGTFGLFGTTAHPPSNVFFNALGLTCVLAGGVLFSRVRPTPKGSLGEEEQLIEDTVEDELNEDEPLMVRGPSANVRYATAKRRIIAFITSLVAGVFYGLTFVPVIYIQDNEEKYPGASKEGLPYVFSHYCGIFLTSSIIFIVYIAATCNKPQVNPVIVGPSLAAGFMWGIAQAAWFVANENLSQAVSFPIIGMLPGALSALWSVFYFREIRGAKNLKILTIAIAVTAVGAVFVGLSK